MLYKSNVAIADGPARRGESRPIDHMLYTNLDAECNQHVTAVRRCCRHLVASTVAECCLQQTVGGCVSHSVTVDVLLLNILTPELRGLKGVTLAVPRSFGGAPI